MMKPTSYGSQNTEEEGRAFVRREVVPPPSRAARSRASARKRVIAGASVVLVGAAVAATCGYVAMSGSSVSTSEDTTTKAVPEPLSLQAATLLESLTAQVGMDDVATFDSLDVDGDGFVTKEEYVGRLEKRRDDVLDKLTQSNLADDVKEPVAAIIRDNFDTEAACVARVFDSSGNKAVDRDAFTFVNPLVISFCKKTNTDALTAGLIPANPDQQEGGGGGETIDGNIPSPTSPGDAGETINGDVPSPSSPGDGGETIDGDVSSPTEPPGDSGETIDGDEPLPTESPTDGGETIDGDEPLPETDAPNVSVDGDDVPPEDTSPPPASDDTDGDDTEPTSPPGNPDDDSLLTDSPSADETERPPSLTDVPIDDSLPGEQISPQPGLPGTPATYDDNNAEGSGLGDTTSEPSDSPDATDAPAYDDDGPTGDDTTPTTDAPGDDNTVDTPSSDAAGPSDEVPTGDEDSTSTPSSPGDNGSDVSEPGSPPSDGSTTSSDTPAADEPGSSTSSGSTASSDTPTNDEPGSSTSDGSTVSTDTPSSDGSATSSDAPAVDEPDSPPSSGSTTSSDAPTMDEPDSPTSDGSNTDISATDEPEPETPMSETPEPWDPSTPSDPNVDAADISPGPVVWDPSEPSMPPSDEVTNVPGIEEPSPSADMPSGSGSGSQAPAPTSPPGSLTSEIDNALKDLSLPNDGTNTTTGGDNGDPAVIQKFLDELNPNSTDSGSNNPAPEEIKSAERVAFEEQLKKLLKHEIKDHAQRLAYANLQIKKNAFMLELIEECVTHAGRRFELDPSFTSDQAIAWIKNDCLVFPHNVMHDASN